MVGGYQSDISFILNSDLRLSDHAKFIQVHRVHGHDGRRRRTDRTVHRLQSKFFFDTDALLIYKSPISISTSFNYLYKPTVSNHKLISLCELLLQRIYKNPACSERQINSESNLTLGVKLHHFFGHILCTASSELKKSKLPRFLRKWLKIFLKS